jgi:hypothetical protein
MTYHAKDEREVKRLEHNLTGQGRRKVHAAQPRRVIIHVAANVQPETLAALAALAMRVKWMGDGELREFIKRVRRN